MDADSSTTSAQRTPGRSPGPSSRPHRPGTERGGDARGTQRGATAANWPRVLDNSDADRGVIELRLLGGVTLVVDGTTIAVPGSSAKVIAYVALTAPNPVDRIELAGCNWPDTSDSRATANLRSTLYRIRSQCDELLEVTTNTVRLQPHVWLDVDHPVDAWWSVGSEHPMPRAIPQLLPGWYDDWVIHERERVRQNVLHDLEASARALLEVGAHATAIDMALQATSCAPLRETPRRLVIEAHLAEGNVVEAVRELDRFTDTLAEELGIEPSSDLVEMVRIATNS